MEFYHYFPSVTFVVMTVDQFVGRDDGPLEQQKQDSHVCRSKCDSLHGSVTDLSRGCHKL